MGEEGNRRRLVQSWLDAIDSEQPPNVLVALPFTRRGAPWVRKEDAESQQAFVQPVLEAFPNRTPPLLSLQAAVRLLDQRCGLSRVVDPEQQELWALRQAFLLRCICMKVRTSLSHVELTFETFANRHETCVGAFGLNLDVARCACNMIQLHIPQETAKPK